jgi:hypothetical protein
LEGVKDEAAVDEVKMDGMEEGDEPEAETNDVPAGAKPVAKCVLENTLRVICLTPTACTS